MVKSKTLDEQREEFARRRLIATPIAGMMAWAVVAVCSLFLGPVAISMVLFAATGSIFYLALLLSKLTGENLLDRSRPKNSFDSLFLYCIGAPLLGFAIAVSFFRLDYTSLPLSVGILTGMSWLPVSWIIRHWIGTLHAVLRTVAVLWIWFILPEHRFFAVPVTIVIVYLFTICVLELRWREVKPPGTSLAGTEENLP